VSGSSKIPTIIYYDPRGSVRAVGAEAIKDGVLEVATDNGWIKSEWCVDSSERSFRTLTLKYLSTGSSSTFGLGHDLRNT